MVSLLYLYHAAILAILLLSLVTVVANVLCFEGLRPAPARDAKDAPLVSVLVPARNEGRNIGACIASLLKQDYANYELLVLDDNSEDGTLEIVKNLGLNTDATSGAGKAARHRLLKGAPLPEGWTGKGWACHQLSRAARGAFLFFTDADTQHAPGTISAAVHHAEKRGADLLSAWPRLVTRTWGECLVIPMILLLGMSMYPHWLVALFLRRPELPARFPRRFLKALGAANGQCMFFRRPAYEKIGGHASLRDHLVEDVALGRAVASRMGEGMRLVNCEAFQFSTCRMYRSFPEVWEGFTKNFRAAFEDSLLSFLGLGTVHACAFLWPFFFLPAAPGFQPGLLIVSQIAVIFLIRVALTLRFRTSWWSAALHPVSEILVLAIGLNSWRRLATTGVTWKGRIYRASTRA